MKSTLQSCAKALEWIWTIAGLAALLTLMCAIDLASAVGTPPSSASTIAGPQAIFNTYAPIAEDTTWPTGNVYTAGWSEPAILWPETWQDPQWFDLSDDGTCIVALLPDAGVDEQSRPVAVSRLDGGAWVLLPGVDDVNRHELVTPVDHLSDFAVFGETWQVFLPLVQREQ